MPFIVYNRDRYRRPHLKDFVINREEIGNEVWILSRVTEDIFEDS